MLLSMTISGILVTFVSMRSLFLGVAALMILGSWMAFRTLQDGSPSGAESMEPSASR